MFRNRNNQQLNECNAAPICSIYFPNNAENEPRHPSVRVVGFIHRITICENLRIFFLHLFFNDANTQQCV